MALTKTPRDTLDRLKNEADFLGYATSRRGYYIDEKACSPRGNPTHFVLRRDADDAKILAVRGPQCWLYTDLRLHGDALGARLKPGTGGRGTILDFIQEELDLPKGPGTPGFGMAIRELRDFLGAPAPAPQRVTARAPDRSQGPCPTISQRWARAAANVSCPYLESRGLSPATLRDRRFAGTWGVDRYGNAVFPHWDASGRVVNFEMKNRDLTTYPRGGIKTGLWRSNDMPSDSRVCITESVIDALSFHQLHPDVHTRYRCASGNPGAVQLQLLKQDLERLPPSATVLLAFDRDAAGAAFDRQVRQLIAPHLKAETVLPPAGKDWNEYLQCRDMER